MKRVFSIAARVFDFEIKPLSEILRAIIRLQNQFIFIFVNLYCFFEVAGFKP